MTVQNLSGKLAKAIGTLVNDPSGGLKLGLDNKIRALKFRDEDAVERLRDCMVLALEAGEGAFICTLRDVLHKYASMQFENAADFAQKIYFNTLALAITTGTPVQKDAGLKAMVYSGEQQVSDCEMFIPSRLQVSKADIGTVLCRTQANELLPEDQLEAISKGNRIRDAYIRYAVRLGDVAAYKALLIAAPTLRPVIEKEMVKACVEFSVNPLVMTQGEPLVPSVYVNMIVATIKDKGCAIGMGKIFHRELNGRVMRKIFELVPGTSDGSEPNARKLASYTRNCIENGDDLSQVVLAMKYGEVGVLDYDGVRVSEAEQIDILIDLYCDVRSDFYLGLLGGYSPALVAQAEYGQEIVTKLANIIQATRYVKFIESAADRLKLAGKEFSL